jgi:hypothetical protein
MDGHRMFEEQISPLAQGLLAQIEVYSRAFDARILRKLNLGLLGCQ